MTHGRQGRITAWRTRATTMAVGAALRGAVALLRLAGPVRASNLAGRLTRTVGPWLRVNRVGDANLRLALPELDDAGRRAVLRGVWDNLGRTIGEFPHLAGLEVNTAAGPGLIIEATDRARLEALPPGPVLLFSGHLGNWEALPRAAGLCGAGFTSIYRAASIGAADEVILGLRRAALGPVLAADPSAGARPFAKGATGARGALAHLRRGHRLGMLVDQKMNDGIEARLFGHRAMTAPALAAMALRYDAPVIGGWVERLGPARLQLHVSEVLSLPPDTLGEGRDTAAAIAWLTQAVNDQIEAWIRQSPGSWLWLHRRWPKDVSQHVVNNG